MSTGAVIEVAGPNGGEPRGDQPNGVVDKLRGGRGGWGPKTRLVGRGALGHSAIMQTAVQHDHVPVEAYLAAEEGSEVRHEYLGGVVYAMAGETRAHNEIVGNLYTAIRSHLKGGRCKLYVSDIRVALSLHEDAYFYYPDLVVTGDGRDSDPRFVRYPKVLIEVLSPSTERVDRREKFFAYTTIASLEEYVLVAQPAREVTVFRRGDAWRAEKSEGTEGVINLNSLRLELPLAAIYEGL